MFPKQGNNKKIWGIILIRIQVAFLALLIAVFGSNFTEAANPKPGNSCSSKGKIQVIGLKKYTCIKLNSKLVWSKPKTFKIPEPIAAPSPTELLDSNVIRFDSPLASEKCKLYSTDESSFNFIDNPLKGVVSSIGKHKIFFAFVRFEDYRPLIEPNTWINNYESYSKSFYAANSYGRLEISEEHNNDWLILPGNASDHVWFTSITHTYEGHLQAIRFALQHLDDSIDFAKYDGIAVVFGVDPIRYTNGTAAWNSAPGNELYFDGKRFGSATTFTTRVMNDWGINAPRVIAHEVGHTFGLQDLYAYHSQGSYSDEHRYVGQVDLMGFVSAKSPSFLIWNRWRLGWIEDSDVFCQPLTEAHDYLLNDTSATSGPRLIVIKSSASERIAVEYRAKGNDSLAFGGLVIYRVNQSANGMGSLRLERVSADPLMLEPQDFLQTGQQKCLPEICITFRGNFGKEVIVGVSGKS